MGQHGAQNGLARCAVRGAAQVVASKKKEIMMWEALREAVDEEMERDPMVCVMGKRAGVGNGPGCCQSVNAHCPSSFSLGEDVGHYGGSYKVTYELYKKYGDMRMLDTPICGEQQKQEAWAGPRHTKKQ